MDCHSTQSLLTAYADGEVDPLRARFAARHLQGCLACASKHQLLVELRDRLRTELPYFKAPPELRQQVMALADREAPRAPTHSQRRPWRWLAAGVAAGCAATLLLALTGRLLLQWSEGRDLVAQAVTLHTQATLDHRLVQVASSDQHTVKPWLSAHLDYSPPVRDLAEAGFPLMGARIEMLRDRPVATLVYQRRQHLIDVFVWPATDAEAMPPADIRGFHVVQTAGVGMRWMAVSDLNAAELQAFIQRLAE